MSQPFLGEIRAFGFNFAPSGWQQCNGQTLAINQYNALFALLGTTYGGNGTSTFQLPNLQGRSIVSQGTGPGLPAMTMGENGGAQNVSINLNNLPSHTHVATFTPSGGSGPLSVAINGSSTQASVTTPTGNYLAAKGSGTLTSAPSLYATAPGTLGALNAATVTVSGGGITGGTVTNALTGNNTPFSIQNPYLVVNYCIAMVGLFPTRN